MMNTGKKSNIRRRKAKKEDQIDWKSVAFNYLQFDENQCDKCGTSVPPRPPSVAAERDTAGTRVCQMSQTSGNAAAQALLAQGGVGPLCEQKRPPGLLLQTELTQRNTGPFCKRDTQFQ